LKTIGFAPDGNDTVYEELSLFDQLTCSLHNIGIGNIILSTAGLIPGYWFSVAFIDTIGRKPIQIGGFAILTILFSVIGFDFFNLSSGGLVALYCLANFFQNFGPNTTTFIVPGEVFPTRYRSTGHGISAASGKVGAIISQALIGPLSNKGGKNAFINHVMQIFAGFMYNSFIATDIRFVGIFTSLLIPETKRKPLEELSGTPTSFKHLPQGKQHS
jgi:PHS family inorganic phosphate transporter-like MFS transporter